MRHQDLTANHVLESWVFANAAARNAAGAYVSSDIGRIGYQQDNGTYWRLTATTPTWVSVGGPLAFAGGSSGQVQFNNAGLVGGTSGATATPTQLTLNLPLLNGLTLNTDADGTVAVLDPVFSIIKNDANVRGFSGLRLKPTLNTGGSNAGTTLDVLQIDTINTAITGLVTNLIRALYGGVEQFRVNRSGIHFVQGVPQVLTLASNTVSVLTTGVPADIATINIPAGITRWMAPTIGAFLIVYAPSASGSMAAATFVARDATGGGGNQLFANLTGPPGATNTNVVGGQANNLAYTSSAITIRQTVASAATGTVTFYAGLIPLF